VRIILISGRGISRAFEFRANQVLAALVSVALLLGSISMIQPAALIGQITALFSPELDSAIILRWRESLDAENAELEGLRRKLEAENEAAGKLLAQMQARLMRMEALGQRVVAKSELDSEEFDFKSEPAVGGPVPQQTEEFLSSDLHEQIAVFADRLRARDAELRILEGVLTDSDQLADLELTGSPVRRGWISSPFGWRVDPINGQKAFHAGVDFAGRRKSDVMAIAGGVVTFAGEKDSYGRMIEISHGKGLLTRYGHHEALMVEVGDVVRKGELIGLMGSSGRSTGSHLHFEVEHNGAPVDPNPYLKGSS
jgi:murein DD-endopeptidase MepM/ murein hydrolase activator NlpD